MEVGRRIMQLVTSTPISLVIYEFLAIGLIYQSVYGLASEVIWNWWHYIVSVVSAHPLCMYC